MSFWVHSFRARRERDYAVIEAPQRAIAKVALAGWRFVRNEDGDYRCYDPYGNYHGINASLSGGASYALHTMAGDDQRPQPLHIWSGRPMK